MAPNASFSPPLFPVENEEPILNTGEKAEVPPASTYPGIWKYPTNRDVPYRMAEDWLDCKHFTLANSL